MEARIRLESTEAFATMAKESPIFAERFALVNTPQEYNTIMALRNLIEFLFRLTKQRCGCRGLVPLESARKDNVGHSEFKNVWTKTKDIHSSELRDS